MSEELHIAGIVVHVRPERVGQVASAISGMPGTEIHANGSDGRLVVTLEAPSARDIAARIDDIQRLDGVLAASLVYQHNEPLEAMMEEVADEDHETGIR
jgi:periplasmic nitrate reductase NapD